MPIQPGPDGILVEVPEGVSVTTATAGSDVRGPIFTSGPVPYPSDDNLEAMLLDALREQGMHDAPAIIIDGSSTSGATRAVAEAASARLQVPVGPGEQAVALVEQGDVYGWVLPSAAISASFEAPSRGPGVPGVIELVVPIGPAAADSATRSLLTSALFAPIRVLVFRFVAQHAVSIATGYQESALTPGLVQIVGTSPDAWRAASAVRLGRPRDGERHRVLLLIHGTFSSTAGGFGQLAPTPWGAAFLNACLAQYDAVLGFDHRTISVDPAENATALVAALQALAWGEQPPAIDVIAHSRGGLVARSLIEEAAPAAKWKANFRNAILVGATNAGTALASPSNWHSFLDLYTNLMLAACRALTFLPHAAPVAAILKEVVSLIGEFVKQIPVAGLDATLAPGLAAMVPGGAMIKRLSGGQAPARAGAGSPYLVISSSFAPKLLGGEHQPKEFPKRLLEVLAAANVSALMAGAENDLVVDLGSMSGVLSAGGDMVRDALHFCESPFVYHTNYFSRPEVVSAMTRWLELAAPVVDVSGLARSTGLPAASPLPVLAPAAAAPASVETDFIQINAHQPSEDMLSAIRQAMPSYVVLERRKDDTDYHYAFSAPELETLLTDRFLGVGSAADFLHEWDSNPTVAATDVAASAGAGRSPFRVGAMPGGRPARAVVFDGSKVIGVLPNASEAVIDADIGSIATHAASGLYTALLRRAMPSFGPFPAAPIRPAATIPSDLDDPFVADPTIWARMRGAHRPAASPTRTSDAFSDTGSSPVADGPQRGAAAPIDAPALQPASAECEFLAETAQKVALGKTLTVRVTLSLDQLMAALPMNARDTVKADTSRPIFVEVWPKRGFELAEDDEPAELPFPTPENPSMASFRLRAIALGRGELWVLARQAKIPMATLKLTPEIVQTVSKKDVGPELQAGKSVTQVSDQEAPPHVLTIIEQDRETEGTKFRFEFFSQMIGKTNRYFSEPIFGDRKAFAEGLYASIESRWVGSRQQAASFEEELRDMGHSLWEQLIPDKLKADLWNARDQLDSIFVISEEPFIPWEILFMSEPGRPRTSEGRFLAELGLVRWLYEAEAAPPTRLTVTKGPRARYAIPSYPTIPAINLRPLPEAAAEAGFLRDQFRATPVEPTVQAASDLLGGPGAFDLFHFAGHGAAARATFDEARLMMTGEDTPTGYVSNFLSADRVASRADFGGCRPIVVLNACQAGRSNFKLTGLGGFARAFLSRKAGLFIGALWSVGDTPARTFTETVYKALLEGKTVAEATRAGRAAAKAVGNATWLSYAVYGHPEAKLVLTSR